MITEIATIIVDPASSDEFEAAVIKVSPMFNASEGCHGLALERIIETPGKYLLLIQWESVKHHMEFRETEAYEQWRSLAHPLFAATPVVEHSEKIF